jgi:membrane-associated phospholipid phosphatase
VALAILVIGHARGWWRWLFLIPAIGMPALVALSRMYRGEHHPTDVLGSLLFAALWITTLTLLIKPNEHDRDGNRTASGGLPGAGTRHRASRRARVTASGPASGGSAG